MAAGDSEQGTGEELTGSWWGQLTGPVDHGKDISFDQEGSERKSVIIGLDRPGC